MTLETVDLARAWHDGPAGATPLVVAHGLFGSGRNWATLARRFAETRSVATVDLRNHGDSPWSAAMDYPSMGADLLAAAEPVAALLGHSMGGKAAMAAALQAPEKVAALVVADIAPIPYAHSHASFIEAMRSVDLAAITRRSDADPMLATAIPEAPLRAFILQNLVIEGGVARWRLNLEGLAQAMPDLLGWPEALTHKRYEGPALFIRGGASEYAPAEADAAIRAAFPEAEIAVIDGAGHWLHAERPAAFFEAVSAWLSRVL